MESRETRGSGPALWDRLVQAGLDLGARLSSQERAIRNARAATTQLSRRRVERDAVELYLADVEEERATASADEGDVVPQQRQASADESGVLGHTGA